MSKRLLLLFPLLFVAVGLGQKPIPQLPQTYIDTTFNLPTGVTWNAHTATTFKNALTSANPGDTIVLDAGVTYQVISLFLQKTIPITCGFISLVPRCRTCPPRAHASTPPPMPPICRRSVHTKFHCGPYPVPWSQLLSIGWSGGVLIVQLWLQPDGQAPPKLLQLPAPLCHLVDGTDLGRFDHRRSLLSARLAYAGHHTGDCR